MFGELNTFNVATSLAAIGLCPICITDIEKRKGIALCPPDDFKTDGINHA